MTLHPTDQIIADLCAASFQLTANLVQYQIDTDCPSDIRAYCQIATAVLLDNLNGVCQRDESYAGGVMPDEIRRSLCAAMASLVDHLRLSDVGWRCWRRFIDHLDALCLRWQDGHRADLAETVFRDLVERQRRSGAVQ